MVAPARLAVESPDQRERRLAWEAARIAEADADIAAGRVISGEEAREWLRNEIAEVEDEIRRGLD